MSKALATSLIILAFIIGIGVGYVITPEYTPFSAVAGSHTKDLGKADQYFDLRYLNKMIAHLNSALYILNQLKVNASHPELETLAQLLIDGDSKLISHFYDWRKEWYHNDRKITRFIKLNLGQKDDKFDLRFLNASIAHHEEAISVAKEVLTKSTRNEILNLADGLITKLSANEKQLKDWREQWYNVK